jgi:hypothetical protein
MRHQKAAERIGTLVPLEFVGGRDKARGPGVELLVACEWLGELLGAIDGGSLLIFQNGHGAPQNEKGPQRFRYEP